MNGLSSPDMLCTAAITLLAVLFFFYTGIVVARMRGKHNVKAPATTGHVEFESAMRVQMNTTEGALIFLPSLWIAAIYLGGWLPPIAGAVWVVGRVVYMQGYLAAPEKRSTGFGIQAFAVIALWLLAVYGLARAFMAL